MVWCIRNFGARYIPRCSIWSCCLMLSERRRTRYRWPHASSGCCWCRSGHFERQDASGNDGRSRSTWCRACSQRSHCSDWRTSGTGTQGLRKEDITTVRFPVNTFFTALQLTLKCRTSYRRVRPSVCLCVRLSVCPLHFPAGMRGGYVKTQFHGQTDYSEPIGTCAEAFPGMISNALDLNRNLAL